MENKQTAVEWLMDKMLQNENSIFIGGRYLTLYEIRERAKAREKEQIKNAWLSGQDDGATICTPNQQGPDEDYYNKTYESNT